MIGVWWCHSCLISSALSVFCHINTCFCICMLSSSWSFHWLISLKNKPEEVRTFFKNWMSYKDVLPIKQLHYTYYRTYLFSGLELHARCNQWIMDPNTHRNHFPIQHFVHIYACNSKTTGDTRTFYISNDCSTIGDVYFLLEVDVRYKWRVMPPNTHHSLFPISHCVYTVVAHQHIITKLW